MPPAAALGPGRTARRSYFYLLLVNFSWVFQKKYPKLLLVNPCPACVTPESEHQVE